MLKVETSIKDVHTVEAPRMEVGDMAVIVNSKLSGLINAVVIKHWKGYTGFLNDDDGVPSNVRFWPTEDFPESTVRILRRGSL